MFWFVVVVVAGGAAVVDIEHVTTFATHEIAENVFDAVVDGLYVAWIRKASAEPTEQSFVFWSSKLTAIKHSRHWRCMSQCGSRR